MSPIYQGRLRHWLRSTALGLFMTLAVLASIQDAEAHVATCFNMTCSEDDNLFYLCVMLSPLMQQSVQCDPVVESCPIDTFWLKTPANATFVGEICTNVSVRVADNFHIHMLLSGLAYLCFVIACLLVRQRSLIRVSHPLIPLVSSANK